MTIPLRELGPYLLLCGVIVADRKGHQLIKVHLLAPICVEERRADAAELEPLLYKRGAAPEAGGDFFRPLALVGKRFEGLVLVGRMHRQPHDVLRQADLAGVLLIEHAASDPGILRNGFRFRETLERGKAP